MPRPLIATINIAAMKHNLDVAKSIAPNAKIWAVVKANAYGHGLERSMRGFVEADGLALIELEGAARLREWGWIKPILLLEGCFEAADLVIAAQYRLDITVHCCEQIDMLECAGLDRQVNVHLKMNTGMNRLGFRPLDFRSAYARLRTIDAVRHITLVTHFANADDTENQRLRLSEQMRRFREGTDGMQGEISLSNSAADLLHPDLKTDWVRPGIMLYGATPGVKTAQGFGLQPAMTLSSEIIGVQDVGAGEGVGYGSRFVARQAMKIGVVACGYADGYPRHAPDGTSVIVSGIRTSLAGRVSMDMMTVDLTEVPTARVGSKVVLWGNGLPIDEVANAAGTIGYELMCALAQRVRIIEQD